MVSSSQDEKLIKLKDEFGMGGYGVYWAILELIANQINNENDQCFVELSLKSWRKVTDFPPKKLQKYLTFCQKIQLFAVGEVPGGYRVESPNILKYKDEYTRKSKRKAQAVKTNVRTKSGATPEEETETELELDLDLKHTSENSAESSPRRPSCQYQKIVDLYHDSLPELPRLISLTDTRKSHIKSRWREHPDIRLFQQFFMRVRDSKFLMGKTSSPGRKPFSATLPWLMRPENFAKVLEGNYS